MGAVRTSSQKSYVHQAGNHRHNVLHFFERKNIDIANILYLTRQNPHTKITFFDGKEILTEIPVKEIAIYLPDEEFVNITIFISLS